MTITTDPVTEVDLAEQTAQPAQETYDQFRERLLLRWCREKNINGWCGTFDNIMVRDLGYTAKEVRDALARFDYHHAATVTFTSNHEIDKEAIKDLTNAARRGLREYFDVENISATTASLALTSQPAPELELTELQQERARVLKMILDNRFVNSVTERGMLLTLGYTDDEISAARVAGRWTYTLSMNWHCPDRINYTTEARRMIEGQVTRSSSDFMIIETRLTPGAIRELN